MLTANHLWPLTVRRQFRPLNRGLTDGENDRAAVEFAASTRRSGDAVKVAVVTDGTDFWRAVDYIDRE